MKLSKSNSLSFRDNIDSEYFIFCDRDGTLTLDAGYTYRIEDLRLLDGVLDGLNRLSQKGARIIIVSNQSGVARGIFTEAETEQFNGELVRLLQNCGITITAVYSCPFHPTEGIGKYRQDSPDRKPAPGMLLRAAREHNIDLQRSYMIGDKKSDILAGQRAGCRTILVRTGAGGTGEPELEATPDWIADDLLDAARIIEAHEAQMRNQPDNNR